MAETGNDSPSNAGPSWGRHTLVLMFLGALLAGGGAWVVFSTARPGGILVWLAVLVLLAAFIVVAGHGATQRYAGFLIDSRNRMTLARLQLVLWTLAILPAFVATALLRIGEHGVHALDIGMPDGAWWLLGISTVSMVGSPLLLHNKKRGSADSREIRRAATEFAKLEGRSIGDVEARFENHSQGTVLRNSQPSEARTHNFFTGDETGNGGYLDLGKIQMFFFTITLVLAYVFAIADNFSAIVASGKFPELGEGMKQLLTLSHAGYLAHKAAPHSLNAGEALPPSPPAATTSVKPGQQIVLEIRDSNTG